MNVRTRIVKTAAAVVLAATAAGFGSAGPALAAAGDPSQWGLAHVPAQGAAGAHADVAGDPSQWGVEKVNEYEGQHR